MSDPDQINVPASPFNTTRQIFNDNNTGPKKSVRYLTRVREPVPIDQGPAKITPRVLRDFGAQPSDLSTTRVTSTQTDVQRKSLVGSFAAVRSARVLHQYRIGFWSDAGIIEYVTQTQQADPSADDITTLFAQFQAFSYLPDDLMPTQQDFADAVSPSKGAAVTKNALAQMGIKVAKQSAADAAAFEDTTPIPILTIQDQPFAVTLSQFCDIP